MMVETLKQLDSVFKDAARFTIDLEMEYWECPEFKPLVTK